MLNFLLSLLLQIYNSCRHETKCNVFGSAWSRALMKFMTLTHPRLLPGRPFWNWHLKPRMWCPDLEFIYQQWESLYIKQLSYWKKNDEAHSLFRSISESNLAGPCWIFCYRYSSRIIYNLIRLMKCVKLPWFTTFTISKNQYPCFNSDAWRWN